jgi:hypothetical protein
MNYNFGMILAGTVLFSVLAYGLMTYGGDLTRAFTFIALIIGAMSQFIGQDQSLRVRMVATYMAYVGMLFAWAAIAVFVWSYLVK